MVERPREGESLGHAQSGLASGVAGKEMNGLAWAPMTAARLPQGVGMLLGAAGLILALWDERTLARGECTHFEGWLVARRGFPQGGIAEIVPVCRLKSCHDPPVGQTMQARLDLVQALVRIP